MSLSPELLEQLVHTVADWIVVVGPSESIEFVNRELAGKPPEHWVGRRFGELLHPEHRARALQSLEQLAAGSEPARLEVRLAAGDGPWCALHLALLAGDDDQRRICATLQDIDIRLRSEQDLVQSHRQLLACVPGMAYSAGPDWRTTFVNGLLELTGYTADEVDALADGWLDLVHPEDRAVVQAEPQGTIATQIYRIITKSGDERWVEDRKVFRLDADSRLVGVDGVVFDITEQRETQQRLNQARERLIALQEQAIRELSTPVIQLWDDILVLPLIGPVDTQRASQLMEQVLQAVTRAQAKAVIVDITGVPVVDSSVAKSLTQVVRASRILGAKAVLTGMSPAVAQTLVRSGISLQGTTIKGNLRSGLEHALRVTGRKVTTLRPPDA